MKKLILLASLLYCGFQIIYAQPGKPDPSFASGGIVKADLSVHAEVSTGGQQILVQSNGSMYFIFEAGGVTLVTKKKADGTADLTYGNNGMSAPVPILNSRAILQADNKIVMVGYVRNHEFHREYSDFAVARLNADGGLDNTFSDDGIQIKSFSDQGYDRAKDVVLQDDGKIVVAGYRYDDGSYNFILARFNNDGTFDNTFDGDGVVRMYGYYGGYANSVAMLSDGKILAAGDQLYRFNNDGSVDSSFSGDGQHAIPFAINSMIIQNGKILTGGAVLARYNMDGSPDKSFILTSNLSVTSLSVQADGKIIATGYNELPGANYDFVVARYSANGSPDKTFDSDGRHIIDFGGYDEANSVVILGDGKLLALGYSSTSNQDMAVMARFNSNGNLDNTFDGDGKLTERLNWGNTVYTATAVQPDGKVLAAGHTWNGSNQDFVLVRYNTDGSYDNTFSGDGKQFTDFNSSNDHANAIAIQGDGKIIVAGSSDGNFALARFNGDGSYDNTFSGDGKQTTDFSGNDVIRAIAVQSNGKIIAGGSTVARYNADGLFDGIFNGDFNSDLFDCQDLAIQNDGKIVITGRDFDIGTAFVARYTENGLADAGFGKGGVVSFERDPDTRPHTRSLAIQKDGKIVIGGYTQVYDQVTPYFTAWRYNSNGGPDSTFGGDGKVGAFPEFADEGASLILQDDGKIILAGYSYHDANEGSDDFTLIRYNTDGSIDERFGNDGIEATKVSSASDRINDLAISGNKLYAAGYGQFQGNFGVLARYLLEQAKAPGVTITNPVNNSTYTAPATITLNATATDADGAITRVRFYNGGALLYTDSTNPYSYTFNNVPAGNYSFIAKATDSSNLTSSSAGVAVTVTNAPNKAPVLTITNPADNAAYTAPANITIAATATDEDGIISRVRFYNGGTLLYTDSISPYIYTMTNAVAGNYSIIAKATDDKGLTSSSSSVSVSVSVTANKAPVVNITAPVDNAIYTADSEVILQATAADDDGTVKNVKFYSGTTLLCTDTVSPYTFTVANAAAGKYSIIAKVTDNKGLSASSSSVAFTVLAVPNKAPVVNITSPVNNAVYTRPGVVVVNTTASDADGSIKKVQFYSGTTLLGTDSTSPYSRTFTNLSPGSYSIIAKATDDKGLSNSSASVTAVVSYQKNKVPSVSITSPVEGSIFTAPATINLEAIPQDVDGKVSKVDFYNGTIWLATERKPPFTYQWQNVPAGNHTLIAVVTDDQGATATSDKIYVSVVSNQPPVVNLLSPGKYFKPPAAIDLEAAASDPDGSIAKVEFYNGKKLLTTERKPPYTYQWQNVPIGNYTLTAVATDNKGAKVTSENIYLSVVSNLPPQVSLVSPGQYAFSPPDVYMEASAHDADGSIAKVDFYADGTLLATVSKPPYKYLWQNVNPPGATIHAKATDNEGAVTTSEYKGVGILALTTFMFYLNGTRVQNLNNGIADPSEFGSVTVCNGGTFTQDRFYFDDDRNFFDLKITSSGGGLLINGYPPANAVISAADYENFGDKHTITLADPAIGGTVTQTVTPFFDLNDNRVFDAYEVLGDPLVLAFTATPCSGSKASVANRNAPLKVTDTKGGMILKLSPNPANSIVNISMSGMAMKKQATLSVISSSGKILKTLRLNGTGETIPLNVSSLAGGLYTIKLVSGDRVTYAKFVKL